MFYVALGIGLFIGFFLGVITIALCVVSGEQDQEEEIRERMIWEEYRGASGGLKNMGD